MSLRNMFYDNGKDYCLRTSLYYTGKLMSKTASRIDSKTYHEMTRECLVDELFPRKSKAYRWSNSGSAIKEHNTLLKRPTKWIYDHFLKFFGADPYKGLNGDQMRALFTSVYMLEDHVTARRIWANFKKRFGFFPSLMEHFFLKPQTMILLFAMLKDESLGLKLLYKISKWFFDRSIERNINTDIEETTNKITLLVTMKILGYDLPDENYVKRVYDIYFQYPKYRDLNMVRNSILKGIYSDKANK